MNGRMAYLGESFGMPAGAAGPVDLQPYQLGLLPTFVESRGTPTYFRVVRLRTTISVTGGANPVNGVDLPRLISRWTWEDGRDRIVDVRGPNLYRLNIHEQGRLRVRDAAQIGAGAGAGTIRDFFMELCFRLPLTKVKKQEDHGYLVASNTRGHMTITVDPTQFTALAGAGSAVASIVCRPLYVCDVRPGAPVFWSPCEIGQFVRTSADFTVPGGGYRSLLYTNRQAAAGFPNHGAAVYQAIQVEGGKRYDRPTPTLDVLANWDAENFESDNRAGGAFSLVEANDNAAVPFLPVLYESDGGPLSRNYYANEAGHRFRNDDGGAMPATTEITYRRVFPQPVKAAAQRDAAARAGIDPRAFDQGISKSESHKMTTNALRNFLPRKAAMRG